jgi:peptidoglycan/LPS O-acetylase OafA/YrhL
VTELSNFLYFSSIGVSVALSILAWNGLLGRRNVWPNTAQRAIKWFAGASFSLYLVHLPIIAMTTAFYRPAPWNESVALGLSLVVFVVALLLAEIAERRKRVYSDLFRRLVASG